MAYDAENFQPAKVDPLTPADVLAEAARLISGLNAWIKGQASNAKHASNPDATAWCMLGACVRASGNVVGLYTQAQKYLIRAAGVPFVDGFNDDAHTTLPMVLDAFARAERIARAEP